MNFGVGEFQPLVNEVVVCLLLVTFQKKIFPATESNIKGEKQWIELQKP